MKALFLLVALSAALCAQTITEGDVVDSTTGAPLAGAYVSTRVGEETLAANTDSSGHFRLSLSQPLVGGIQVYRAGFLRSSAVGIGPMRVALTPQAAISGKVLDEDGFPAENVVIEALRFRQINSRRQLKSVGGNTQANDLGEYRLAGLPAGRYYLHVTNPGGRHTAQYYPGTLDLREASVIEVKAGEERDVGIQLVKLEAARVAGQVVLPAGATPVHGIAVSLQTVDSPSGAQFHAPMREDGTFTISRVPPGAYVLRAVSGNYPPAASDLLAEQRVEVGAMDVRGIVLNAHPVETVDLAGTVVFEGGAKPRPVVIGIDSCCRIIAARADANGAFVLKALLPVHYSVKWWQPDLAKPGSPEAAHVVLSAARLGDKELPVSDAGFELDGGSAGPLRITFTAGVALSGKVLDEAGRPVAGATVVFLLPLSGINPAPAGTGSEGVFICSPILPGDYRVYVLPDPDHWELTQDPDYLKAHENDFPPVRVNAGANPSLTLHVPAAQQ